MFFIGLFNPRDHRSIDPLPKIIAFGSLSEPLECAASAFRRAKPPRRGNYINLFNHKLNNYKVKDLVLREFRFVNKFFVGFSIFFK